MLWNKYRIEAIGSIHSSLGEWNPNCESSRRFDFAKGFIGLQVHSHWQGFFDGWKNGAMEKYKNRHQSNLEKLQTPDDGKTPEINLVPNQLSEREKRRRL